MEQRQYDDSENKHSLREAFLGAHDSLITAPFETKFQLRCQQLGISAADHEQPLYWEIMAQYQAEKAQDESLSGLESYAQTLASYTPSAILHKQALESSHLTRDERHMHKEALSGYNTFLREFAGNYPDISATELLTELLRVTQVTVAENSNSLQAHADTYLRGAIHGAQHELGFKSILDQAVIDYPGLSYRTTTVEEDLKGGDYVITLPDGKEIIVDVKASLDQIDGKNSGNTGSYFHVTADGQLVILSCLTNAELGAHFTVPEALAKARVVAVMGALFQASIHVAA